MKRQGKPKLALDTSAVNSETKDELAESFNATVNTFTKYTKNKDGKDERISVGGGGEIIVTGGDERVTTTPTSGELDPDNLVPGKELGRGASSYVQMVSDKRTGKKLALKVLNVFDKNMRAQLLSEFNLLFQCDCDALVKFHGAFYREGKISVALEFMDRGSLDVVMKKTQTGKLPEKVLAAIAFQCLWGLSYLRHEHRLHRDIKPQNVLLNKAGHVKLTDFGISRELENSIGKCMTIVGTFKYMSPERILGKDYSYASDIWSLGLMLIECATGQYPFAAAGSMIEMAQTVTEAEPPSLLPEEDFSDSFHEFVSRCMCTDDKERETAYNLLGYDWLAEHDANSMEKCQTIVREYFKEEKERKRSERTKSLGDTTDMMEAVRVSPNEKAFAKK